MQNDPNKISVKVNGKDRPVTEVKEEQEVAAAIDRESIDTPFDWVLPKESQSSNAYFFQQNRNENQTEEYQPISYDRKPGLPIHRKKHRVSMMGQLPAPKIPFEIPKKLLIPIVSAVIIGSLIGLIVLMIFTGKDFQSQSQPTTTVNQGNSEAASETPVPSPKAASVDLTATSFIVQGGVFSTSENAQEFADNVIASGFAAAIDLEDNRVLIGVGGSMDEVRSLAGDYQSVVADAYPYDWTIGGNEITVTKENKLQWLVKGKDLFEKLTTANASEIKTLESDLLNWKKDALTSVSALSTSQQQKSVAFINSLSTISESTDHKWGFQQAKLDSVIYYKSLVNSLE